MRYVPAGAKIRLSFQFFGEMMTEGKNWPFPPQSRAASHFKELSVHFEERPLFTNVTIDALFYLFLVAFAFKSLARYSEFTLFTEPVHHLRRLNDLSTI